MVHFIQPNSHTYTHVHRTHGPALTSHRNLYIRLFRSRNMCPSAHIYFLSFRLDLECMCCANDRKCFYWSLYVDIQFAHYSIRPISRSTSHYSFSRFSRLIQMPDISAAPLIHPWMPLHIHCDCCCCSFTAARVV